MTAPPTLVGFAWRDGVLDRRTVVRCALARVCGACGRSLGRPVVFVGTRDELDRNSFHLPPLHEGCGQDLLQCRRGGARAGAERGLRVRPAGPRRPGPGAPLRAELALLTG